MDDLRTTFTWIVIAAFITLTIIDLRLPKASGGIISVYDAGMLSIYLVALAWGAIKVVGGEETGGWLWIIMAAGLFGSRMYFIFNDANSDDQRTGTGSVHGLLALMWLLIQSAIQKAISTDGRQPHSAAGHEHHSSEKEHCFGPCENPIFTHSRLVSWTRRMAANI